MLGSVRRAQPLGDLSTEAEDKLLSILLVRDIPAGTCLCRADDPATNLYIIEDGKVELSDPRQGGKVFERLTGHDVFGRMSFATGLRRATEAHTVGDTRLLVIPRDAFMVLLEDSGELREIAARTIRGDEVATYLKQRHGLSAEEVGAWREQAVACLAESGHYDPPIRREEAPQNRIELMKVEEREGFFAGLSDQTLRLIAGRLVNKTDPEGYGFFYRGQSGDRP